MCAREESNLHGRNGHQALNLARLPIPPRALNMNIGPLKGLKSNKVLFYNQ